MTQPRVAIYCRVSTDHQEQDGSSLDSQMAGCQKYAAANGWEVVAAFRETASGAILHERPKLRNAMDIIAAGGADVLLCYALDRLSRDQNHAGYLLSEIEQAGAKLDLVTENFDDTPMGRVLRAMVSFAAELERQKIKERTYRGKRQRAEKDKRIMPGHKPPYGYVWAGEKNGRFAINPVTGPILQRMYTTIASGGSAMQLAREFSEEGIPTPTGKMQPWRGSAIAKMLKNERYAGRAVAFATKTEMVRGKKRNGTIGKIQKTIRASAEHQVVLPEGTIPALVSRELFDKVQARLISNRSMAKRNNRHPEQFLLRSGFVQCGHCGRSLITGIHHPDKTGGGWNYYVANREHRAYHGCPNVQISAQMLDDEVEAKLRLILEDPAFVRQFIEPSQQQAMAPLQAAEIGKAIADRKSRTAKLLASLEFLDGDEAAQIRARIAALAKERKMLEGQLAQLEAVTASEDGRKADMEKLYRTLERAQAYSDNLTYTQKRQWLEALGFRVLVWAKDHSPRWEIQAAIDPAKWEAWEVAQVGENPTEPWPEERFVTPTLGRGTAPAGGWCSRRRACNTPGAGRFRWPAPAATTRWCSWATPRAPISSAWSGATTTPAPFPATARRHS